MMTMYGIRASRVPEKAGTGESGNRVTHERTPEDCNRCQLRRDSGLGLLHWVVNQMTNLDVAELKRLIEAYVRTLNGEDRKEWFTTQRALSEGILGRFVQWIERDGRTRWQEAERSAAEPSALQSVTADLLRKADDSVPDPDPLF